ncbi:MAG: hypothetical protein ACLR56_04015 [Oscillospiraceae bacterium]
MYFCDRVFLFSENYEEHKVTLARWNGDREQFILDNQESFKYGAIENSGLRDDRASIDAPDSETYRILYDGRKVGIGRGCRIEHKCAAEYGIQ